MDGSTKEQTGQHDQKMCLALARKRDSVSDAEILWAKNVRGVWGLANVFANGKLYFARTFPEANCLPQGLKPPAKPPTKHAPKAAKPCANQPPPPANPHHAPSPPALNIHYPGTDPTQAGCTNDMALDCVHMQRVYRVRFLSKYRSR